MSDVATFSTCAVDACLRPGARVHMLGICGVGMAGLAVLLRARGVRVDGCDDAPGRNGEWLAGHGIAVRAGHAPGHLAGDVDAVIRTPAVPADSPEVAAARARGIPVCRRAEVLAALLNAQRTIAIAGTHGKTTTSAFTAQLLRAAGRDPSFFVGGDVAPLGGMAGSGAGAFCVAEADESDGTLGLYRPEIGVVTNIEFDHMEHFDSVAAFEDTFRAFMRQARRLVVCADDPRAAALAAGHPAAVTYGFAAHAALRAEALEEDGGRVAFTLARDGRPLGRVRLGMPGRHNVLNALAAAAAGFLCGLTFDEFRAGAAGFVLPRRRWDKVFERGDVTVVSDYAHHPTEVRTVFQMAARAGRRRTLAVFQPHRYTRTRALGDAFPAAFAGADSVLLLPVYAASEPPLAGGTVWDLYARFRAGGAANVAVAEDLRDAWPYLRTVLRRDDLLLAIGAGSVERVARQAADELAGAAVEALDPAPALARDIVALGLPAAAVRAAEPMARHTTLGVGGRADVWVEMPDAAALAAVRRFCRARGVPLHLVGAGSNLLVGDLGVRGVVARLSPAGFGRLETDGIQVRAGAAVPLPRLARRLAEAGLTGLEFLEGIPGTVGGAVRMNAGAWGGALGEHVAWVLGVDADGAERRLAARDLVFGYRSCAGLADLCLLEVGLTLEKAAPDAIRARMTAYAARRAWMRGLRSAGSVFRNPPGQFAGRLIEACGGKGLAVGGARISERHANVIVTEPGAAASDVRCVMELARARVRADAGVALEPELVLLGAPCADMTTGGLAS